MDTLLEILTPSGVEVVTAKDISQVEIIVGQVSADNGGGASAGGTAVSGPSVVQSVMVVTGTEARPSVPDVVLWVDTRADQTTAPTHMGANDIWSKNGVTSGGSTSDTSPPTVPTGLASASVIDTGFTLSWSASVDDTSTTGYEVFKDGVSIGTTVGTSKAVSGLTASTAYSMTVRARDAAGNWSAQSSPLVVNTTATPGGGGSGTRYSIYGASAPTGTFVLGTDGTPTIETAQGFYKFNSSDSANGLPSGRVVGGRVWIPPGASSIPNQVTFRLYAPGVDLGGTPAQTKVVPMTGVVAGSWVEGLFDTPQALGADSSTWMVSVQFTGSGDAGKYVFASNARPLTTSNSVPSASGKNIAWAEVGSPNSGRSARFKIGTGAATNAASDSSYGVDVLVDAGA